MRNFSSMHQLFSSVNLHRFFTITIVMEKYLRTLLNDGDTDFSALPITDPFKQNKQSV